MSVLPNFAQLALLAITASIGGAGLVLLLVGAIGRLVLDDPRCRGCGYDLRTFGDRPSACPECGRDLTGLGAVRFGRRHRRPALVWIGLVLILVSPALLFGGAAVGRLLMLRSAGVAAVAGNPRELARLSHGELATVIAGTSNGHWPFAELHARLTAGSVDRATAARFAEAMLDSLDDRAAPLPPGPFASIFGAGSAGDRSLELMLQLGLLDEAVVRRFAERVPPPSMPTVMPRQLTTRPTTLVLPQGGGPPNGVFRRVLVPREIRVDGVTAWTARPSSPIGRRGRSGTIALGSYPAGEHEVQVDYDWYVLLAAGPVALPPLDGRIVEAIVSGQTERLPIVRSDSGQATMTVSLYEPGDVMRTAIADPDRREEVRRSVTVTTANVLATLDDGVVLDVLLAVEPPFGIPIVGRVVAEVDGQRHEGRRFSVTRSASRRSASNRPTVRVELPALDPAVRSLTITVEPDLTAGAGSIHVDSCWAEPIVLENVPLKRLDLDVDGPGGE